jgi:hypothetical protein
MQLSKTMIFNELNLGSRLPSCFVGGRQLHTGHREKTSKAGCFVAHDNGIG